MGIFNHKGRVNNSIKTSSVNLVYQLLNIILNFVYRTIFIKVLAIEYLGLNGLFTDILSLLSLAELGIGSSIAFRLYKPIKDDNIFEVASLMNFYRNIYRYIALVVIVVGLIIMPLLPYLIKDSSELPADINLYILYAIFLAQSVSGYFFSYKQTLLNSDQRGYVLTLFNIGSLIIKFCGQITILFILKNYLFTLVYTVAWTILSNIIISIFITKKYKEVFKIKDKLPKEIQKEIIKDTRALMLHKIGGVVLNATDSIVIAAVIGIQMNGVLSNYILIIGVIKAIFNQLMSGVSAGLGSLCSTGDKKEIKRVYDNYRFASMWLAGFCGIGLMCLINPFITVWLKDPLYLLNESYIIVIILSNYIVISRNSVMTLISAAGLFRKDRLRPLIEAVLNLGISLLAAYYLGLYGVYIGTIFSCLFTCFWREPRIAYKYIFEEKETKYWADYLLYFITTMVAGTITYFAIHYIPDSIGYLILKFLIVGILPNLIFILVFYRRKEFKYYLKLVKGAFKFKK